MNPEDNVHSPLPAPVPLSEPASQETGSTTSVLEKLQQNTDFLISSIVAQGKIPAIESTITSLTKRIEKIESDKIINWNKATVIITVIIAFVSLCISCTAVVFGIYEFLSR
jgi:hypothetical protein